MREDQAAKQSGRYAAIQHGSQGVAAVVGAAIATIDITLCFTLCGIATLVAAGLTLTMKEPPHVDEDGAPRLGYWKNLQTAVGIAARRPVVRALLLLYATVLTLPLVVYYVLLQPYAIGVGLPIATLGIVVAGVQLTKWSPPGSRTAPRVLAPDPRSGNRVGVVVVAQTMMGALPSSPRRARAPGRACPGALGPLLLARINDLIPSAQRATILSLSALMFELGLAVSMPLCSLRRTAWAPTAIVIIDGDLRRTAYPCCSLEVCGNGVWLRTDATSTGASLTCPA